MNSNIFSYFVSVFKTFIELKADVDMYFLRPNFADASYSTRRKRTGEIQARENTEACISFVVKIYSRKCFTVKVMAIKHPEPHTRSCLF